MRLTNLAFTDSLVRQMQQLGATQARLQTQVSTGQKITNPEDAPATVAEVLRLETEQRQVTQFGNNAERALEVSQATYSGLQQLKQVMDRVTEIGTLATGAIDPSVQQSYGAEVNQLLEETVQIANSKFGGNYLFAGTQSGTEPFQVTRDGSGQITGANFVGNTGRASIALSDTSSVAPGASADTLTALGSIIGQLRSMRDALNGANSAGISSAQQGLLASENNVVAGIADQGGIQTRIAAAKSQQSALSTNLGTMISNATDADMPTAIMQLSQAQTAYQAALQSSAKIMGISLLDYLQ